MVLWWVEEAYSCGDSCLKISLRDRKQVGKGIPYVVKENRGNNCRVGYLREEESRDV